MITINNHLGTITYSKQFFYSLIGGTVTNCFGIVGMNAGDAKQTFGVNVSTIVKSIIHKVRFAVEDETGFTVDKVNVFVDAVKV